MMWFLRHLKYVVHRQGILDNSIFYRYFLVKHLICKRSFKCLDFRYYRISVCNVHLQDKKYLLVERTIRLNLNCPQIQFYLLTTYFHELLFVYPFHPQVLQVQLPLFAFSQPLFQLLWSILEGRQFFFVVQLLVTHNHFCLVCSALLVVSVLQ